MRYATYLRPGFGRETLTIAGMEFRSGTILELGAPPTEDQVDKAKADIEALVAAPHGSRTLVVTRQDAAARLAQGVRELRDFAIHGPIEDVMAALEPAEEAVEEAVESPESDPPAKAKKKASKKKASK